uniref:Secreted protein n=1 Tax=Arundo donax TaxID=35708 RepID=A0A0A9E070_ARUDO
MPPAIFIRVFLHLVLLYFWKEMEYEPVFGSLPALKLSTLIPKCPSTEFPKSFSFPIISSFIFSLFSAARGSSRNSDILAC